jgi:quinol-cytochrome oxidoreductase complex cytochrome b subunit
MGLHLVLIIKQKHTQPGYARKIAEPGKVLGVSLWPYQAILAGQLLFFMFGGLFLLSALCRSTRSMLLAPLDRRRPRSSPTGI